jgi:hypothetical protein
MYFRRLAFGFLLGSALLLAGTPIFAQEKEPSGTDLSEPAGTSRLELPPSAPRRTFNWVFGVKVQKFQPTGQLKAPGAFRFNLSRQSPFYLPSLELGTRFKGPENETGIYHWGILAHGGYTAQDSYVFLYNHPPDSSAKLTTLLSDIGLNGDFEQFDSHWGVDAAAGLGMLGYSQSGISNSNEVSDQSAFRYVSFGAHSKIENNWQVFLLYTNRNLLSESRIELPTDSLELGTRFIW